MITQARYIAYNATGVYGPFVSEEMAREKARRAKTQPTYVKPLKPSNLLS